MSTYDYKNKTTNIRNLNHYMLDRTLKMFEYEGLPDTIPARELEEILQTKGFAYITEVKGELYAFHGGMGGELNEYYKPTEIVIANPWLKFNDTLNIEKDGVLVNNDDMRMGLWPLFNKYHTMLVENDITMVLNSYNNRVQTPIAAGDDATKEAAEVYLDKIQRGEQGVIAEQRIFEGITVHNGGSSIASNTIALTEFNQFLRATLLNEIGLDANFNMKRERLTEGEVEQNDEGLYPLITNMLYCRRQAIKAINEKYDLNIRVAFGSVWKNRNLEGELDMDLQLGHTDDMEEGQIDTETLAQLDSMIAAMGAPMEVVSEEQPEMDEQGSQPEEQQPEATPEEAQGSIALSEEALNLDLDSLPAEQRLEIYDIIFKIDDEEDIDSAAQRIADILEGTPSEEPVEDAEEPLAEEADEDIPEAEEATEEPVEATEEEIVEEIIELAEELVVSTTEEPKEEEEEDEE